MEKEEKEEYRLVSIEEMRELLKEEAYKPDEEEDFPAELLLNKENGTYYTDFFSRRGTNLILSHILADLCIENWFKLDLMRTLDGYNPYIQAKIIQLYRSPLVWQKLPREIRKKYVITGRFAEEVKDESRISEGLMMAIIQQTNEDRVLWFVFSFDEVKQRRCWDDEDDCIPGEKPNNMPDWSIFTTDFDILTMSTEGGKIKFHVNYEEMEVWSPLKFEDNLRTVYSIEGAEKAIKILRALRSDWPHILAKRLFKIETLSQEELEDFRRTLFEGMDYEVAQWEKEIKEAKEFKEKQPKAKHQDILPIPPEGKYNKVREYIEERKKFDEEFKSKTEHLNLRQMSDFLSDEFGWLVNENSLGKNINRNS